MPSPLRPPSLLAASLALLALSTACPTTPATQRTHSSIAVEPLALDFGLLEGGQSKVLSVKVSNTGPTDLIISGATLRNDARSAFSVSELAASIAPGGSAAVQITYRAPDAEGPDGALWVIESDADNAPELDVSLTGRAAPRCQLGLTFCAGICVDTANDLAHCGSCTAACQSPDKCLQGRCGCEPRKCAELECGDGEDGCGAPLRCGDCAGTMVCIEHRCLAPTCTDHLKDGKETDVDCGGSCSPCALDRGCATAADCQAGLACIGGVCSNCRTLDDCPRDQVCRAGLCGSCQTRDECGGGRACLAGRCLTCPDEAAFNECGLCGGAPVSSVGAPCASATGCASNYVCNAQLVGVECPVITANACNKCGGPLVSGLGDSCTAPSGCPSAAVCNAAGDGAICAEVAVNECGLCGGPPVSGIGANCIDAGGCPSTFTCNAAGTGVSCSPVGRNECGLCGGLPVPGIGDSCTTADGCPSTLACDGSRLGTVCTQVAKNECGVCGGPAVAGVGTACVDADGCSSSWACDSNGTGRACAPVGKNECGICGGPAVPGIGTACTAASGCSSALACDTAGTGTVCSEVAKNECGLCGGAPVPGLNVSCSGASGCSGTTVCNLAGDGLVCDAPASCGTVANHVVISQLCGLKNSNQANEFIELYNPTANAIDIGGYTLWYRRFDNITTWGMPLATVPAGTSLPSHQYFLAAFNTGTFAGIADLTYSSANIAADDGQVLLTQSSATPVPKPLPTSAGYVDMVGYGTFAKFREGTAAPSPGNEGAIIRKAKAGSTSATMANGGTDDLQGCGIDTDDNGQDFVVLTAGQFTAHNSSSPAEP